MPLLLSSPAFAPGGAVPSQYTCDGAERSPPLAWSGAPAGTSSLVLVVADPDAPGGIFHRVYDIPSGHRAGRPAAGLRKARNDFDGPGHGGPCLPRGSGVPPYHFRLMAISRPRLDLGPAATVLAVEKAATSYTIARTERVGTSRR